MGQYRSAMAVVRNRALRVALLGLGWLMLGIAFIGVAVPVIPTTGPVILAAFLFSRSSDRFDRWLLNNRFFGQIVRDWRAGAGFSIRAKVVAVAAIMTTFTISVVFAVHSTPGRVLMIGLGCAIAVFVVTRPTKRPALEPQPVEA
jgi:uncharacterized membrane protein YbaN (DUF454 family)